jgi:hypothetical protein
MARELSRMARQSLPSPPLRRVGHVERYLVGEERLAGSGHNPRGVVSSGGDAPCGNWFFEGARPRTQLGNAELPKAPLRDAGAGPYRS